MAVLFSAEGLDAYAKAFCLRFSPACTPLRLEQQARYGSVCCSFPCTMVDRITPITGNEHIALLEEDYGIGDKWPVIAEDFKQWVIGVSQALRQ